MRAQIKPGYMNVLSWEKVEGDSILTVACADFNVYQQLPAALEINGIIHSLTGWNSDRCVAYYKNNRPLARLVWS